MIWLNSVLIIFNILIAVHCFFAWREVWGLQGGFGKGCWSDEYGGYLYQARESRRTSTLFLILFSTLNFFTIFGG